MLIEFNEIKFKQIYSSQYKHAHEGILFSFTTLFKVIFELISTETRHGSHLLFKTNYIYYNFIKAFAV